mmetsp:Transcript_22790/g.33377  ORF Transcript_22790/g.33377 Transcript_22790/m.33377 type:complete len:242 (-) Transcript_22790:103-828(-)
MTQFVFLALTCTLKLGRFGKHFCVFVFFCAQYLMLSNTALHGSFLEFIHDSKHIEVAKLGLCLAIILPLQLSRTRLFNDLGLVTLSLNRDFFCVSFLDQRNFFNASGSDNVIQFLLHLSDLTFGSIPLLGSLHHALFLQFSSINSNELCFRHAFDVLSHGLQNRLLFGHLHFLPNLVHLLLLTELLLARQTALFFSLGICNRCKPPALLLLQLLLSNTFRLFLAIFNELLPGEHLFVFPIN